MLIGILGLLAVAQADTPNAGDTRELSVQEARYTLTYVPAGSFEMGSPQTEADRGTDEALHTVTLSKGFHIGTTEVTQGLYTAVTGEQPWTGSCYTIGKKKQGPLFPAPCVSWSQAMTFCNKLSELEGRQPAYAVSEEGVRLNPDADGYRLPTDAEWEYAARAGERHAWAGSDDVDAVAWYQDNSGDHVHEVGTKKANAWGLHDMSGNLWEWVWDWYHSDSAAMTDPVGPETGEARIFRGGAYSNPAGGTRAAIHMWNGPDYVGGHVGFRVVLPE